MTDPTPLTGDELATIKARAEAATPGPWEQAGRFLIEGRSAMLGEAVPVADVVYDRDVPHIAGMDPETTLRLVAEVKLLRAQVERAGSVTGQRMMIGGHMATVIGERVIWDDDDAGVSR
jgi:hypothetical protein